MHENNHRNPGLLLWFFVAIGIINILLAILLRASSEVTSDLLINIGATLIATSLLSYLYQRIGVKGLTEQLIEIQQSFEIVKTSSRLGITIIWKERRDIQNSMWNEFTRGARQEIWLFGVAEYGFAVDEIFHQIVADGIARGCAYKILLLDPDSPFAKYWDGKDKTGMVSSKISAAIQRYQRMIEQNQGKPGSIELRVYDETPSVSIVRTDESMLLTFYLPSLRGDDCLTLQIQNTQSGLFTRYLKHFHRVWETAKVVANT